MEYKKHWAAFSLKIKIDRLKSKLDESDYKIIKTAEYSAVGLEPEYDLGELHQERQRLRDQINELQVELDKIS